MATSLDIRTPHRHGSRAQHRVTSTSEGSSGLVFRTRRGTLGSAPPAA
jgi:hypothetical protein